MTPTAAKLSSARIVLTTLNARYIHASLGLRYLYANMDELLDDTTIIEFIITQRPVEIAEHLLSGNPVIVGFGVYIWNVREITEVIGILKSVRPDLIIIVGGPEVSFEIETQRLFALVDHVITGQADRAFVTLCRKLLISSTHDDLAKVIQAPVPTLADLAYPYEFYSDVDLAQRLVYVEASRGCPYKCQFCLSSLDKTAWPFDLDGFLNELERLYARGARHFKFVDRTFNLNTATSSRILDFFLEHGGEANFAHFELVPDHLPDLLKERISRFEAGTLQFEIGVQTLNPEVQARIARRQNNDRALANIAWLLEHSQAHVHLDLIAGLPGEDLDSFGSGFDRLWALQPHEIQVGILKRLRGSPIMQHTQRFDMRYNPEPPYNVLSTGAMDFATMQRVNRFARYWDLIANSGRFPSTTQLLLGDQPFARFMAFSDWLYAKTGQTHQFAMERLYSLLYEGFANVLHGDMHLVLSAMADDFQASGHRSIPEFLKGRVQPRARIGTGDGRTVATQRQVRHVNETRPTRSAGLLARD